MPKFPASAAVLLLLALGATACKKADAPADRDESASAPPAATAPASAEPAAAAPTTVSTGDGDTKYQCSTGLYAATYKAGTVTLKLKDKTLELKADPDNPERFIGTGVEWWTNGRGSGATASLYALTPEGEPGDVLEGCVENPKA